MKVNEERIMYTYIKLDGFKFESPSGLHYTNRSGSSLESVFESPVYRIHNEHNLNLLLPNSYRTSESKIAITHNHTQRGRELTHPLHTYTCTPHVYTKRSYTHVYMHTLIHTIYTQSHSYTCIYPYIKHMHAL